MSGAVPKCERLNVKERPERHSAGCKAEPFEVQSTTVFHHAAAERPCGSGRAAIPGQYKEGRRNMSRHKSAHFGWVIPLFPS